MNRPWLHRLAPAALLGGPLVAWPLVPERLAAQEYLPSLDEAAAAEVGSTLEAMKRNPRGPYLRIRWFCADGTVQPPQGAACRERGGGVQHAEMSPEARALGPRGFHPGTILTATSFEELFDRSHAHDRLKQLLLDQFLFEIDDGWVLRQARYYRGARQAEDEEQAGEAFLRRLLADPEWVGANYWLARQLVDVVPHTGGRGAQSVQRIRNLASEIADIEPEFLQLRIKIHSFPSSDDLAAVRDFLGRGSLRPPARDRLIELRDALARQYDRGARAGELAAMADAIARAPEIAGALRELSAELGSENRKRSVQRIGEISTRIRERASSEGDGSLNLSLLVLDHLLHAQALVLTSEMESAAGSRTRSDRLRDLETYFDLAYGAGFLTARERDALHAEAEGLADQTTLPALEYRSGVTYLARSIDWSTATVRSYMSPALERYTLVEPRAAGFVDASVRGSTLLTLSGLLALLAADADAVLGASHVVLSLGEEAGLAGVRGLNPGVALGPLEVGEVRHPEDYERSKIYAFPETTPELRPVAGVLTLDAGNLLSHVQLLARNLGIPNASIPSRVLPELRAANGREVFYAVSPLGRVVLREASDMSEQDRSLIAARQEVRREKIRLDTSRLDLTAVEPVPLEVLGSDDSGVLVGPKAANLGALASTFPGRVSPGVALTFGMFVRHVSRSLASGRSPLETLGEAYAAAAGMRARGDAEEEIDQYMFGRLAEVRAGIVELEWLPDMRARVTEAVERAFGTDLSAGIFVRSDTNVEDLPQFSGAGLNLTLPNRRTLDDVLSGIKQVWTSPFSERAYLWRKQILEDQGEVYPSVLLLQSVPSSKSGVMITSGLQNGTPEDLTVATGEGVGGAVDGEGAETILVRRDGSTKLLTGAKSPVRRVLVAGGGARLVPALRPEHLLTGDEIEQLRQTVATWKRETTDRTPGRVWDFEFGFVGGQLWLFQVRPFVRFRSSDLLDRLSALDTDALANATRPVPMEEEIR